MTKTRSLSFDELLSLEVGAWDGKHRSCVFEIARGLEHVSRDSAETVELLDNLMGTVEELDEDPLCIIRVARSLNSIGERAKAKQLLDHVVHRVRITLEF